MIVVDTNIIGYLYLTSERSAQVEQVFQKDPQWVAPVLWRSEFRNVLALYLQQNLLTLPDALSLIYQAEILMQNGEYEVTSARVLSLAQSSGCSAYDCEFVALSQDLDVPLVTVDKKILREFPDIAILPEVFIAS